MKKLIVLLSIFSFLQSPAQQSKYWQQQVDINIHATLNDSAHTLTGHIQINYSNHSPDTLHYIWIHLWPNAYKNDRTALTDELLQNGSTDFYFSKELDRGYINRLNFEVNNELANLKDHPQHQDIGQLILPRPLLPGASIRIESDFNVKIPALFSRSGHLGQSYQITQWYPKPAVYDAKGWHAMPYSHQAEFYNNFGNYSVALTLPKEYKVAATGKLINQTQEDNLQTLQYQQDSITDFAWFADKNYIVLKDSLQIGSKQVEILVYHLPNNQKVWANGLSFIKNAIRSKTEWLGPYPYNTVTVVEASSSADGIGGMEYPTITVIAPTQNEQMLHYLIHHEVGHNWFQAVLASNERMHPWMDEGMNSYYDHRYFLEQYNKTAPAIVNTQSKFLQKRLPTDYAAWMLSNIIRLKKDQPIQTAAAQFSGENYSWIPYEKTAQWMQLLEKELGTTLFDSVMKTYFTQWQFKHPYPADFLQVAQAVSGKDLTAIWAMLSKKGALHPTAKKQLKFSSFFNFKHTDKYHYISAAPLAGANYYDKLMLGGILHNYNLPRSVFEFFAMPLFATGSKKLNGMGAVSFQSFPGHRGNRLQIGLAFTQFTGDQFIDSTGKKNYQPYGKWVPTVKFEWAATNPRSTLHRYIQWKTFLIAETGLRFHSDSLLPGYIITYPKERRFVNQLELVMENNRKLYPYKAVWNTAQGNGFVRTDLTLNYFFNYATGGGMDVRLFGGKFFYTGSKTFLTQFKTNRYHLNMTGPKGYEDYNYQNYFYGRNEFEGLASQQIMIRDGAFKVRTDLLSSKIGKTDDWLGALNLTTTLPDKINPLSLLPVKIPIKLFADMGTYADAWKNNASTPKLLYDAGFQLSMLGDAIKIYVPLLYSKLYADYFKSTLTQKRFWKTISFSIDVQNISLKKLIPFAPF